jgi:hypothetical protein
LNFEQRKSPFIVFYLWKRNGIAARWERAGEEIRATKEGKRFGKNAMEGVWLATDVMKNRKESPAQPM